MAKRLARLLHLLHVYAQEVEGSDGVKVAGKLFEQVGLLCMDKLAWVCLGEEAV